MHWKQSICAFFLNCFVFYLPFPLFLIYACSAERSHDGICSSNVESHISWFHSSHSLQINFPKMAKTIETIGARIPSTQCGKFARANFVKIHPRGNKNSVYFRWQLCRGEKQRLTFIGPQSNNELALSLTDWLSHLLLLLTWLTRHRHFQQTLHTWNCLEIEFKFVNQFRVKLH